MVSPLDENDDVGREAGEGNNINPPLPAAAVAALLDWSAKQSRILTADGLAPTYYSPHRGYDFRPDELPHHHLLLQSIGGGGGERNSTYATFRGWSRRRLRRRSDSGSIPPPSPVIGAWSRPLFAGTWEHSTSADEVAYNVQTGTLFVDVRIPTARPGGRIARTARCLSDLSDDDLRLFARQHAFGGYAVVDYEPYGETPASTAVDDDRGTGGEGGGKVEKIRPDRPVCTRHHCIDWNLMPGRPRNRPNKWWIELPPPRRRPPPTAAPANVWKEWSYATDERNQHYYMERWERLEGDDGGRGAVLALRKVLGDDGADGRDGILVVVGDHFSYISGPVPAADGKRRAEELYPSAGTVVELVDCAIAANDRGTAESCLNVDGGHGTVSSGWRIDASVRPWREGTALIGPGDAVRVEGWDDGSDSWDAVRVVIDGTPWEVLECCGVRDGRELETLFGSEREAVPQGGSRL